MNRTVLLALVAACLVSGCDDGPTVEPYVDAGPPPRVGICTPTSGTVSSIGQFAMLGELDVQISGLPDALVAICPDPQVRPARILARVEMTDDGMGGVSAAMNVCVFELPTVFGGALACPANPADYAEIILAPGAGLDALLPTILITFDTGLSPSEMVGNTFTTASVTVPLGTNVANTDPLPYWDTTIAGCDTAGIPADCVNNLAGVTDDDGDGELGVTLTATASPEGLVDGEAYVAARLDISFTGVVQNANCTTGTVDLNLAFEIIDSDVNAAGLALTTPLVIQNIPPFDFLPTSTVKILRADDTGLDFDDDDDGTVTCAEILNNEGQFQR